MPLPVIIDTDPGIDDALAIALAVRSPELQVLAVTTVYGNAPVATTTRNARHLLKYQNAQHIPVWRGAARPLLRELYVAAETHGEEGLGYAEVPALAETDATEGPNEAAPAILRILKEAPGPITMIALGPLTNIALALAVDRPLCRAKLADILWMGGSAGAPGNTTPVSEYNAWCDPEAARSVFEAGIPLRMVGLDATRCVLLADDVVRRLEQNQDPAVRWWASMWRFYVEFHLRSEKLAGCIMNDPLAVALLLQPELGRFSPMYVEVDCGWGQTRGQTICDRFGFTGNPPNAQVCVEAAGPAALALAMERGLGVRL